MERRWNLVVVILIALGVILIAAAGCSPGDPPLVYGGVVYDRDGNRYECPAIPADVQIECDGRFPSR